ncbi:MAG TPA: hypothetical protein VGN12_14295 [Pirellulales bacterium]
MNAETIAIDGEELACPIHWKSSSPIVSHGFTPKNWRIRALLVAFLCLGTQLAAARRQQFAIEALEPHRTKESYHAYPQLPFAPWNYFN